MQTKEQVDRLAEIEADFPFPQPQINRLDKRRWILNQISRIPNSVGAEIGVFRGHFSELISTIVEPKKFYLVDPWEKIGETFGWGGAYTNNKTLPTKVAKEESVLRSTKNPDVEVIVLEDYFPSSSLKFEEKLDWVYLDASHRYENTLEELHAIPEFLTQDGVILGDDWDPRPDAKHHAVFRAISDFCRATNWNIVAAGPGQQWCIRRYN